MKKLITMLTIVVMLSGCGVAKNLQDPGSKPAPTLPKSTENACFWDHFSEDALTVMAAGSLMGTIVLGYVVFYYCVNGTLKTVKTPGAH